MPLGRLLVAGLLLALWASANVYDPRALAQGPGTPPRFKVEPFWPKPLPVVKGVDGLSRHWVTGEVGASCIDSHDHIITVNRGFAPGGLLSQEGTQSIPAAPVIIYDTDGNIVSSWGDPTLTSAGAAAVLPNSVHGCFADHDNNIWIAGNADGVVQKWSHDGRQMLLQIGTKGMCDGPASRPKAAYPTCGEPGFNASQTLLNSPADIAVDPNPDPVTGERGSIYIADGYGNHRIVVFDAKGKFLRQWGAVGAGSGQFVETGGGHPHCVVLGKDGTVYACDRGQNRIHAFDRMGVLKRTIEINPSDQMKATLRACDLVLSSDANETFMFVVDLGSDRVWILDRETGRLLDGIGRPGHMAGEFTYPHSVVTDSRGNLYVAETIGGRRHQKFAKVS